MKSTFGFELIDVMNMMALANVKRFVQLEMIILIILDEKRKRQTDELEPIRFKNG